MNRSGGDDAGETVRVTRRSVLKAGGALTAAAWAVPVVQLIGMDAASATTTSGGGGGGGSIPFPSHVELLVKQAGRNATVYGVKYDQADTAKWDNIPDNKQMCAKKANKSWTSSSSVLNVFKVNAKVQALVKSGGIGYYRITLPAGYELKFGYAKCGQNCVAGTLVAGTTDTYDFACS